MDTIRYDYGDAVRVIRNIRNDGTYPGLDTGAFLVRRGSIGYVQNVGTFLQDQVIYSVHFLKEQKIVGCREEELIPADAPWTPSRFEFRDKVKNAVGFSVDGELVAPAGSEGEILKVVRDDDPEQVHYHVRFPGHTLLVAEQYLSAAGD
ncbi:MAG: nitrogen fixation protein NifZ [Methylococcaceae bacterium]|nr:MAG: nitrogen fixation protein NifZ [Methylococcaceae bacterium]